jgi:hypothetical protein
MLFRFRFRLKKIVSVSGPQNSVFVFIFPFRFCFSAKKSESFRSTFSLDDEMTIDEIEIIHTLGQDLIRLSLDVRFEAMRTSRGRSRT